MIALTFTAMSEEFLPEIQHVPNCTWNLIDTGSVWTRISSGRAYHSYLRHWPPTAFSLSRLRETPKPPARFGLEQPWEHLRTLVLNRQQLYANVVEVNVSRKNQRTTPVLFFKQTVSPEILLRTRVGTILPHLWNHRGWVKQSHKTPVTGNGK